MPCERLALPRKPDPNLVAATAARIRRGELVVLPTETVYGLAVRPQDQRAVDAVRELKGRDQDHPFTWHLAHREDLAPLCGRLDPRVQRLVARYWPGPLTVVVPARDGGTLGARLPAHEFTRDVIAAVGGPIWLTSVNRTGQPPLCDPAAIEREFGHALALLVDDGVSPLGTASTVIRCTGPLLEVLREGILSRDEVLRTAAARILFVCTGNTCRSPLAEALARAAMGRALSVPPDQVLARGLCFQSAGTRTLRDMPASDHGIAAAAELQLDLAQHRSQPLSEGLLAGADRVYCLGSSNQQAIAEEFPALAAKATLLHPDGRSIVDPFGGALADYRRARDDIAAAIAARLEDWRGLLPA